MDQKQSKKSDQYGISWNPEYGPTNNCTNLHMSLPHESVLVEVIEITVFVRWEKKCETKKKKENKDPRRKLDPTPYIPSSQKIERLIDGFIGSY